MSPHQFIENLVRDAFATQFSNVHLGVTPGESAPYPFAIIGAQDSTDNLYSKRRYEYTITQDVHVYHNDLYKRGHLRNLIDNAIIKCRYANVKAVNYDGCDVRMVIDNTTQNELLHFIVSIQFAVR